MLYTLELMQQINDAQQVVMVEDDRSMEEKSTIARDALGVLAKEANPEQLGMDMYYLLQWNADDGADEARMLSSAKQMAEQWRPLDNLFGTIIADTLYQQVVEHFEKKTDYKLPCWDEVEYVLASGCGFRFLEIARRNLDNVANGYATKLGNSGWAGRLDDDTYEQFFEENCGSDVPEELRVFLKEIHDAGKPYYMQLTAAE